MKVLSCLLPILTILLLLYYFCTLPNLNRCVLPCRTPPLDKTGRGGKVLPQAGEERSRALGRGDALPILAVTLLYALTAFFRLGSTADPQTFTYMPGEAAVLELPEGSRPSLMVIYPGVGTGNYSIKCSEDGENYQPAAVFEQSHVAVFKWAVISLETELLPRYIRITCLGGNPWLGEVAVLDGDGQPIPLKSSAPALCDEQDVVQYKESFQTSSYFDEIYHARTAWEHLNGVWPYEITHPPLGKIIIGLGISLFGMTPFGWRFSGTLFGVLMLPLLYVFLKKLFGGRWIPTLGTVLWATDFMHYVQTRIATIDTYSVFFILLMYFFMYLWLTEDKSWALGLSGVSFGLGAAAKWTSIYAGIGLALLWAAKWIWRFHKARRAAAPFPRGKKAEQQEPDAPGAEPIPSPDRDGQGGVFPAFLLNVCFCLLFFVGVPVTIYYFSYLPYGAARGVGPFTRDYLQIVVENQLYMFNYHAHTVLGSTHPYSSVWTQWLLDLRPILYVLEYPHAGTKISIAAWLNPVLCWGGLLSLPVLGWMAVKRRDRRAAFLLLGYLSQLLPWVGIQRLTFAYHYFPSSLFLVLAMSYVLCLQRENRADWRGRVIAPVFGALLLFILFFPVLNGLEVNDSLSSALLRWMSTWPV